MESFGTDGIWNDMDPFGLTGSNVFGVARYC